MTGGDGTMLNLSSAEAKEAIASGRLWARLRAAFAAADGGGGEAQADTLSQRERVARVLLGCGSQAGKDTEKSDMGIVLGHAYSILSVHEVDGHKVREASASCSSVNASSLTSVLPIPADHSALKIEKSLGVGHGVEGRVERQQPRVDAAHAADAQLLARQRRALSPSSGHPTADAMRLTDRAPVPPSKAGDGVFFMEFSDWLQNYRTVYFCYIYPQEMARVLSKSSERAQRSGNRTHWPQVLALRLAAARFHCSHSGGQGSRKLAGRQHGGRNLPRRRELAAQQGVASPPRGWRRACHICVHHSDAVRAGRPEQEGENGRRGLGRGPRGRSGGGSPAGNRTTPGHTRGDALRHLQARLSISVIQRCCTSTVKVQNHYVDFPFLRQRNWRALRHVNTGWRGQRHRPLCLRGQVAVLRAQAENRGHAPSQLSGGSWVVGVGRQRV